MHDLNMKIDEGSECVEAFEQLPLQEIQPEN
jgi:hypothetical protein